MNKVDFKAGLSKVLLLVSGLVVFGLALIGSIYLVIAGMVVMLSVGLISRMGLKPQPVKARQSRQPLDAECRVVRRK